MPEKQIFSVDNLPSASAPWGDYRKITLTKMVRIDGPFTVDTDEGRITCQDGFLAIDARGFPYPIAADEHARIYERA